MNISNKHVFALIKEVMSLCEAVGINKVKEELYKIRFETYKYPTISELVLTLASREFSVSKQDIKFKQKSKCILRYNARAVFSYIMCKECKVKAKDVAKTLNCTKSNISMYCKYVKELDEKIKADKEVIEKIEIIKNEVSEEIKIKI